MLEMHFDILIEYFSPNQLSRIRPNLDSEEHLIGGESVLSSFIGIYEGGESGECITATSF